MCPSGGFAEHWPGGAGGGAGGPVESAGPGMLAGPEPTNTLLGHHPTGPPLARAVLSWYTACLCVEPAGLVRVSVHLGGGL